MQPAPRPSAYAATATILALGYVLNLWATNWLRDQTGGIDSLWSANAFVIGAILLLPTRWTRACLAAGFLLQATVVLAFGHQLIEAIGFSLLNTVEAIAVAILARRLNAVRLTTPGRFARLLLLALAPVLLVGTLILGGAMTVLNGVFPAEFVVDRLMAKFLGMSIVLPAILMLARRADNLAPARLGETIASFALAAVVVAGFFTPLAVAALLVLFPVLAMIAVRLGPQAVAVTLAAASFVMLSAGLHAPAASLLAGGGELEQRIILTQVYLAMLFATGVITALMATHHHRLRALVLKRSANYLRARDRAQAATLAKTDFLATMSHEIRTPLNAIIGFAQVLDRRADVSGEVRHQVGLVRNAGDALLTVVNDILDFSKVEAGRIELDPKPVQLAKVCRDAVAIVADSARGKGLSLDFTVSGEADRLHLCDDHRLRQVLLNYLNNAVKFTDVGGVTVDLSILDGDTDRSSDTVRIAVHDTGVGLDPEGAAKLFQRFSQVDSSVSRTHGGTGLGLAICRGLIEAMGGEVGVTSRHGAGSTFWLELSLPRANPSDQAGEILDDAPMAMSARVLLVDDHPMNRELGQTILHLLGCEVDVACDGREAIEAAQRVAYDVILMDIHMPVLDGLAATRAIKALRPPASSCPILAMSADVLPEQVARMRAAGMVDAIAKPIRISDLQAALVRWVGHTEDIAQSA